MEKIESMIYGIVLIALLLFSVSVITLKNNEIKKLENQINNIELPNYYFENQSGTEHRYFNYAGVEFSLFTKEDYFYGCNLREITETWIYCELNKTRCKVEIRDNECINKFGIDSGQTIVLNNTGCVEIFEINGNLSKRFY